jgi:hypothetical protein
MLIEAGLNDFEDFSPVPPGSYEFIIKEPAEIKVNKEEKTDTGGALITVIVKPEVVGGEQAGKKVRRQLSNRSKASRFFLRSFLEKVGVQVSKVGGFASEELLGRRFKANVSERMYKDADGNEKKAAELEENSIVSL